MSGHDDKLSSQRVDLPSRPKIGTFMSTARRLATNTPTICGELSRGIFVIGQQAPESADLHVLQSKE